MTNTAHTQLPQNSVSRRFLQPHEGTTLRSVRQDNPAPPRARTAVPQPASPTKDLRSRQLQTNSPRTHPRPTPKRKTLQLALWVKPVVKAELERIAQEEGLSVSSTGAAFLEKALQQNLHSQHAMLLDTVIEKAIGKHMRAYSNRLAVLLVRSLFTSEQTRSIVTNILGRQEGVTPKDLATIITASENKARGNIARITPQLKTLIEAVQSQLEEEVNASG